MDQNLNIQRVSLAIILIFARQTIGTDCPEGKMMVKNVCVCSSSSKLDECKGRGTLDHIRALNRGKCNDRGWYENGVCKCDEGWSGVDCWTVECENNGKQKDRFNICECPKGFRGARCEEKDCGKGREGPDGNCECHKFWEGDDCRVPICQNNGTLVLPSSENPTCNCTTWFRGYACQFSKCEHGNLNNNRCVCVDGFEGDKCTLPKCVHGARSYKDALFCEVCEGRWEGLYCDWCFSPNQRNGDFCCPPHFSGRACEIELPRPAKKKPKSPKKISPDPTEKTNFGVIGGVAVGACVVLIFIYICWKSCTVSDTPTDAQTDEEIPPYNPSNNRAGPVTTQPSAPAIAPTAPLFEPSPDFSDPPPSYEEVTTMNEKQPNLKEIDA